MTKPNYAVVESGDGFSWIVDRESHGLAGCTFPDAKILLQTDDYDEAKAALACVRDGKPFDRRLSTIIHTDNLEQFYVMRGTVEWKCYSCDKNFNLFRGSEYQECYWCGSEDIELTGYLMDEGKYHNAL